MEQKSSKEKLNKDNIEIKKELEIMKNNISEMSITNKKLTKELKDKENLNNLLKEKENNNKSLKLENEKLNNLIKEKRNNKKKFSNLVINSEINLFFEQKLNNKNELMNNFNEAIESLEIEENNHSNLKENEVDLNLNDEDLNLNDDERYSNLNQKKNITMNENGKVFKKSRVKKNKKGKENSKEKNIFINEENINSENNNYNLQSQIKSLEKQNKLQEKKINELQSILDQKNSVNKDEIYLSPQKNGGEMTKKQNNETDNEDKSDLIDENNELKIIINDLREEINIIKQSHDKDIQSTIVQSNEKLLEKDMIIEELTEEFNKLDKEYKLCCKEIITLQNHISQLEKNIGVEEHISNLKHIINEKENIIMDFSEQIKEYQSQCDDIIAGNSMEEKDEQIKMLINEVKGIRTRLQNLISFEGRINDFDEFLDIMRKIKNYIYKSDDKDIKQYYEQLNLLVETYELNGQKFYNKIIQEIFGINYEEEEADGEYNNDNNMQEHNDTNNENENINFDPEDIDYINEIDINDDENYINNNEGNNEEIDNYEFNDNNEENEDEKE